MHPVLVAEFLIGCKMHKVGEAEYVFSSCQIHDCFVLLPVGNKKYGASYLCVESLSSDPD